MTYDSTQGDFSNPGYRPDLGSKNLDLGFGRPDLGYKRPDLGSWRPN